MHAPSVSWEGVAQHTLPGHLALRSVQTTRCAPLLAHRRGRCAGAPRSRNKRRLRTDGMPPVSTVQDLVALDEHRCAPAPSPRLTGSTGSGTSSPGGSRPRSPRAYRRARTGHSAVVSRAAPTSRRRPAKPRLSACQRRGSAVCKDVGHKSRTCKFGPGKGSSPSCPAPARRGALTRYVILTGDALPADSNDANALDVI